MSISPLTTLDNHFSALRDPRQFGKIEHPLLNIIFITICAVLCGADDWEAVERFGHDQKEWLCQYLNLEKIPSHDTFGRFYAIIDPVAFRNCFLSWIQEVCETMAGVVAIDGKTHRGSHDKRLNKGAIHMVSAWGAANGVVLGQMKVGDKSNEITAIPQLIAVLNLQGCIVTIDAMGCQTEIAAQIIEKKGDYVLSLKGNQGQMHEDTQEMFAHFEKIGFANVAHDYHKTVNKGHGRLETRECWSFNPSDHAPYFRTLDRWKGLQTVAMVRSQRIIGDKVTIETRFTLNSISDAKLILQSTRLHWGIENKVHWVLDVAFREDLSRVRQGYAAENLGVIRHIALNLLRKEKTSKAGIKNKRLSCALNVAYRETVLAGLSSLC